MGRFRMILPVALVAAGCSFASLSAQSVGRHNFCKPGTFVVKRFYPGDTIQVQCDTVYMMNRNTFRIYDGLYRRNPELMKLVDESLAGCDARIAAQEEEYSSLSAQLNTLMKEHEVLKTKSGSEMERMRTELSAARGELSVASAQMDRLTKELQRQKNRNIRKNILWGCGGACAGILLTLILQ